MKLALVFATIALTACGSGFEAAGDEPKKDAGADATSGGTGGAGGSSGDGGGSATGGTGGIGGGGGGCPPNHRCVPPAPTGWNGPLALTSDSTCPDSWNQESLVVHDGLSGAPPECVCGCTPHANCPGTAAVVGYNGSSCGSSSGSTPLVIADCLDVSGLPFHGVQLPAATGTCTGKVTENIPTATWVKTERLCQGGAASGNCSSTGETCLPTEGVALCIEQAGDAECPASYPAKHTYYTSLNDTRACPSSCGCTAEGTFECTASFTTFSSIGCASGGATMTVLSGKTACIGGVPSVELNSINPSKLGTCTPGTATGSGEVQPTGQRTVCCTE